MIWNLLGGIERTIKRGLGLLAAGALWLLYLAFPSRRPEPEPELSLDDIRERTGMSR